MYHKLEAKQQKVVALQTAVADYFTYAIVAKSTKHYRKKKEN
jgi:hypothetical protein